jgi:elongation factor G
MIRVASMSRTGSRNIYCRCGGTGVNRILPRVDVPKAGGSQSWLGARRFQATSATSPNEDPLEVTGASVSPPSSSIATELKRLRHIRNVGIFAHVDAGKTTVTERMLALTGIVKRAGSVDDGSTVTDFLPAERERGITIQSAAISFPWKWHNNDNVQVSLIDTPGHVDFSVEVNRSVAVLDGAVLIVDAVAGVQAQTETVWRAMTRPLPTNHDFSSSSSSTNKSKGVQPPQREPLACLALINKMDKDGCHFGNAIKSLRQKLPGANPLPIQVPLFRGTGKATANSKLFGDKNIIAIPIDDVATAIGEYVGVIDLIYMRAIIWPDMPAGNVASNVENCVPTVIPLMEPGTHIPLDPDCPVTQEALAARANFLGALAECDEEIEEFFLNEEEPSNAQLRIALRRATLSHRAMPVMASAALRGKGVEPVLDAIADLLPSPLDRLPPALINADGDGALDSETETENNSAAISAATTSKKITLGHPLHPGLLAFAFKVLHMKGRGGSGEGRVVFCRVYSGEIRDRQVVEVMSPAPPGEAPAKPRSERVGGMLELAGGSFGNVQDGICKSGGVCALVGLKSVVTGDTIVLGPERLSANKAKKNKKQHVRVYLAGVTSPKPVLTVRLEAESMEQQTRLSEALVLLTIEDPSLVVEETESVTLLSGLGELHIEVTLDRIQREFGLHVLVGAPSVTYRETITDTIESPGLVDYDRTIGGTRLQGAVHLVLEPTLSGTSAPNSSSIMLTDPVVTVSKKAREFLGVDLEATEDDLIFKSEVFKALVEGCRGALKRGPLGPYAMANVTCHVVDVDAEAGRAGLMALPGALRAAAASAISTTLATNRYSACSILEPTMSVEVTVPNDMVGTVLSDFSSRRGTVGDVFTGESVGAVQAKALVRGEVPLVEILGYANSLRSLTAGEGAFTAEYTGHSPCGSPGS